MKRCQPLSRCFFNGLHWRPYVTAEEAAAAVEKEGVSGAGGQGSSWNKAGTWEERGHTDWAKARVNELLIGKSIAVMTAGATAAIKTVKTFTGDATVVMAGREGATPPYTAPSRSHHSITGSCRCRRRCVPATPCNYTQVIPLPLKVLQ